VPTDRATEISLHKGYPVLTIYTGRKYEDEDEFIRFGRCKAQAILEQLDQIRDFVLRTDPDIQSSAIKTGGIYGKGIPGNTAERDRAVAVQSAEEI
jgi:hypothetical protein